MIYLAFRVRDRSLGARLIRWWTRGRESHVGISFEQAVGRYQTHHRVLDASADLGVWMHIVSICPDEWELEPVPWITEQDVKDLYDNEWGCGYDWRGILGSQIFPRAKQHPDKWFCSELAGALLKIPEPQRLSPHHLRLVVQAMRQTWEAGNAAR